VLDAIRIAGRWVKCSLLDRLTARTVGEHPPSRHHLVRDFCRWAHWRNRKGELCVSSARVALKRIEAQGLVRLPPPLVRPGAGAPGRLRDDGQPLPPLPKLPKSLDQIPNLRISLIADHQDPQHLIWNRLISRQHPLQGAPLVGTQLRYLLMVEGVKPLSCPFPLTKHQ
jgi:hypothetical protein